MFYILIQVLLFKDLVLFESASCMIFIAFLLLLPVSVNRVAGLLIGFAVGFLVDVFYDTLGINAAVCTFLMYARPYWMQVLTPQGGYDNIEFPSISELGFGWFLQYASPLVLFYTLGLFTLEAGSFSFMSRVLLRALSSFVFSMVVIVLVQLLFYHKKKAR
ncbi:MAG: hypothetical protein MI784_08095 [Cytophagales bacterium]|nr:hypothetical protein [Cytophagales bacterium]